MRKYFWVSETTQKHLSKQNVNLLDHFLCIASDVLDTMVYRLECAKPLPEPVPIDRQSQTVDSQYIALEYNTILNTIRHRES